MTGYIQDERKKGHRQCLNFKRRQFLTPACACAATVWGGIFADKAGSGYYLIRDPRTKS